MPKSVKVTLEQQLENELRRHRRDMAYIPEPTIIYKKGQKVIFGAHKATEVEDVVDNGKIIKVRSWGMYQVYSKMEYQTHVHWVSWYELCPIHDKTAPQFYHKPEEDKLSFGNTSIDSILKSYHYHFGIDLNPVYQREHVWSEEDQVALIESIYNNIEIGKFVILRKDEENYCYEILDGKQRLTALAKFYEGRLKYKGYYFHELCMRDRDHFENYHVPLARSEEPWPLDRKIRYFLKLNSAGRIMSQEHLNKVAKLIQDK